MVGELSGKAAIVGLGYSKLERRSPRPLAHFAREAAHAAIADAGLRVEDIDGLGTIPNIAAYGNTGDLEGIDIVSVPNMIRMLGRERGIRWHVQTPGLCPDTIIAAAAAVAAGACDYALVWRAVNVPKGRYSDFSRAEARGEHQFRAPYGFTMPAAWQSVALRKYMHDHGSTREDMAAFVVQNRANTQLNPKAYWHGTPLTVEEYLEAPMVADPFCLYDCDIPVDGCVAVVLASAERARDLAQPPAYLTGYAQTTWPTRGGFTDSEHMWEGAAAMGEKLWASAGLGPSDMDVAMLYDGFSVFLYVWLEGLGFVPRGEAASYIASGATALDGELPLNTSGCSLGEGRLHGMAQVSEAVLQVMGRAEGRQIEGAAHAVATVGAGTLASGGLIFSREARA